MPYFVILPAFVLYVAAMLLAIAVATVHRPAAWLRPYFVSVLLWSSIGFVLSTVLYVAGLILLVKGLDGIPSDSPSTVVGITLGLVVFVVPFAAAGLGIAGGAMFGIWRRLRRVLSQVRIPTDFEPPEL